MIAAARHRLGWTQDHLALALGVTRQTVSELERGRWKPSAATLAALKVALKPHLDEWNPKTRERGRPRRMEA